MVYKILFIILLTLAYTNIGKAQNSLIHDINDLILMDTKPQTEQQFLLYYNIKNERIEAYNDVFGNKNAEKIILREYNKLIDNDYTNIRVKIYYSILFSRDMEIIEIRFFDFNKSDDLRETLKNGPYIGLLRASIRNTIDKWKLNIISNYKYHLYVGHVLLP